MGASRAGFPTTYDTVVEIGPGKSLGTGLCALLCGTSHYYAWDIVSYSPIKRSLALLDQLAALFEARTAAPEGDYSAAMFDRRFPAEVLTDARLDAWLAADRVSAIRAALSSPGTVNGGIQIEYRTTIDGLASPADLVFSQAVMEHVDDIDAEYARMYRALGSGGVTSHQIDFKSHGFARDWNGHWTLSDRQWRLIRGARRFAINRAPLHEHVAALSAAGFSDVAVERIVSPSALARTDLQPRFSEMPGADLTTSSALVQARKP